MNSRAGTRIASGIAALAVVAAGVLVATPAYAADISVTAIAPDDSAYLGWHNQLAGNPGTLHWDGLRLGGAADSYVLNGLVAAGTPGLPTTGTALGALITSSSAGSYGAPVLLEVPFSVAAAPAAGQWGTFYSVDPFDDTPPALTDLFISTKTITGTGIAAGTPTAIGTMLASLELTYPGAVRYSGFGVYAVAAATQAVIGDIIWGGDTYYFGGAGYIAPTSTVKVGSSEIRQNEATYPGWHEGYVNATPAFAVQSNGLRLGIGANSQIINGLTTPFTGDVYTLLNSFGISVVSGEAFLQVPVFYGPGSTFATLRSAGLPAGDTIADVYDGWESSKAIPATATTAAIAANTAVRLGDLIDALNAQGGSLRVLAFGVLANSSTPSVVSSLTWNGVTYTFVPTLAATGTELPVAPASAAAALALLGAVMIVIAKRRHTRNGAQRGRRAHAA